MLYVICATVCVLQADGTVLTATLPTFYVDGQVTGLDSEHEAEEFARAIVDPHGLYERVTIHACPIGDYLRRVNVTANLATCAIDNACER
jgi:hypothetical protein